MRRGKFGLVLAMVGAIAFLAGGDPARSSADDLERAVFPKLDDYRKCGQDFFFELGKSQPNVDFDSVETTVAQRCSQHLQAARRAMASFKVAKKQQSRLIASVYDRTIRGLFVASFYSGQKMARSEGASREIALRWGDCVFAFAAAVMHSNTDGAETIVDGAFAACQSDEDAYYAAVKDHIGGQLGESVATDLVIDSRKALRRQLIAAILSGRAAKQGAPQAAPAIPVAPGSRAL